ncbi:MAG: alpha/beta fold hydrolase [Blastocatellia bacterium]|nr:alpha/beta fold hydrolase [Blastocatellia bacterium]
MKTDLATFTREAFEIWQWHADAAFQQWMRNPLLLSAQRSWIQHLLPVYAEFRRVNQRLTGVPSLPEALCRETSRNLAACLDLKPTAHTIALELGKMRLRHFRPARLAKPSYPLVIVTSLVNRWYLLDLAPGRSLVEFLTQNGIEVFVVDWGEIDETDSQITFDTLVLSYLPQVLHEVCARTKRQQVDLLGYSMGGVLSLICSALNPALVRRLALFATPVDFSQAGFVSEWLHPEQLDIDDFIATLGNMPSEFVLASFRGMKPVSNATLPWNLWLNADSAENLKVLLALECWFNDSVDIPGTFYRQFVASTYQKNQLFQNRLKIGSRRVRLDSITCPVLNVIGEKDQVVPFAAAAALAQHIPADAYHQALFPYGHLSLSVSGGAKNQVWPQLLQWLRSSV